MDKRRKDKDFLAAYETYADAIFRYCYFKTSDRELARDLVQQTFLQAWAYIDRGEKIIEYRPFLYRLANNLVIDWYRRKKSESLDLLAEAGLDPADNRPDSVTKTEISWALHRLNQLKPDDQALILWRYVEDMSPREIAEAIGVKENIASVRIHRALERWRKLLQQN